MKHKENTFFPACEWNICYEKFVDKNEKEITLKRLRIFLHSREMHFSSMSLNGSLIFELLFPNTNDVWKWI